MIDKQRLLFAGGVAMAVALLVAFVLMVASAGEKPRGPQRPVSAPVLPSMTLPGVVLVAADAEPLLTTTTAAVLPSLEPAASRFASCAQAREAGAAPVYAGQPGYWWGLDRNGDGVTCE